MAMKMRSGKPICYNCAFVSCWTAFGVSIQLLFILIEEKIFLLERKALSIHIVIQIQYLLLSLMKTICFSTKQKIIKIIMFPGTFSPSIFFKASYFTVMGTLVAIYYISQYYQHEDPFPHCWISGCAGHYPEYILFRIATITGSAFFFLGWMTNLFYLKSVAREKVFRLEQYHPEVCMIMGMMGSMGLMGSTASIDTGIRNQDWHTRCASTFFVFTFFAQTYNTIICSIVRYKIKTLSLANVYLKLLLLALNIIQLYISSHHGAIGLFNFDYDLSLGNDLDKLLEWTFTFTIMTGFYSMALDCQHFRFEYSMAPSTSDQLQLISEVQ